MAVADELVTELKKTHSELRDLLGKVAYNAARSALHYECTADDGLFKHVLTEQTFHDSPLVYSRIRDTAYEAALNALHGTDSAAPSTEGEPELWG